MPARLMAKTFPLRCAAGLSNDHPQPDPVRHHLLGLLLGGGHGAQRAGVGSRGACAWPPPALHAFFALHCRASRFARACLGILAFYLRAPTTQQVTAGQLVPALSFVVRHPEALTSILALSAASTCGQLFIRCARGRWPSGASMCAVCRSEGWSVRSRTRASLRATAWLACPEFFLGKYFTLPLYPPPLQPPTPHPTPTQSPTQPHHQDLRRAAVCHSHDHAPVPLHPALLPAVCTPADAWPVARHCRGLWCASGGGVGPCAAPTRTGSLAPPALPRHAARHPPTPRPLPDLTPGTLYYKSFSRGPPKPKSVAALASGEHEGKGGGNSGEDEALPLKGGSSSAASGSPASAKV